MSIKLGSNGKLQLGSTIALLLITVLAVDHCNCDQGKRDRFFVNLNSLPAPFIRIHLGSLLFSIVDCCCWMQFFVVVKLSVCNVNWRDERDEARPKITFEGVLSMAKPSDDDVTEIKTKIIPSLTFPRKAENYSSGKFSSLFSRKPFSTLIPFYLSTTS